MKTLKCNIQTICAFIALTLLNHPLWAGQANTRGTASKIKGIRIVTDQALVDSNARFSEFTGNVAVTIDDDTEIHADWIKIRFKPGILNEKKPSFSEKSIQDIVAKGNVKIILDDKVAITEEALYIPDEDTLTLSGGNSRISMADDYITGEKITLNRKDGTFKLESLGKKQVEAVFFQKGDQGSGVKE
jgi:lipopolysaccharide transport protein LptA